MRARWANPENVGILYEKDGQLTYTDSGDTFEYLKNIGPDPYEPLPLFKRECAPSQMRVALHRLGLLTAVTEIAALDPEAAIVWEFAKTIYRDSPFIAALANNPVQTFTSAEIDAIFDLAMSIEL